MVARVVPGSFVSLGTSAAVGTSAVSTVQTPGSYTVPAHNGNAVLVVVPTTRRSGSATLCNPTAVTHNGVSLTEITACRAGGATSSSTHQRVYYLRLGSSTPAGAVAVTIDTNTFLFVDIYVIDGVSQAFNPVGASTGANTNTTTAVSSLLAGVSANALVLDLFMVGDNSNTASSVQAANAPQSEVAQSAKTVSTAVGWTTGHSNRVQGAAASDITMSWTYTSGGIRTHHSAFWFEASAAPVALSASAASLSLVASSAAIVPGTAVQLAAAATMLPLVSGSAGIAPGTAIQLAASASRLALLAGSGGIILVPVHGLFDVAARRIGGIASTRLAGGPPRDRQAGGPERHRRIAGETA